MAPVGFLGVDAELHTGSGKCFTPNALRRLFCNVTYRGQIRYKEDIHAGEHVALVDERTWQQVQTLLREHHPRQGVRLASGALLQGHPSWWASGAVQVSARAAAIVVVLG
jgi:hypothetical protein